MGKLFFSVTQIATSNFFIFLPTLQFITNSFLLIGKSVFLLHSRTCFAYSNFPFKTFFYVKFHKSITPYWFPFLFCYLLFTLLSPYFPLNIHPFCTYLTCIDQFFQHTFANASSLPFYSSLNIFFPFSDHSFAMHLSFFLIHIHVFALGSFLFFNFSRIISLAFQDFFLIFQFPFLLILLFFIYSANPLHIFSLSLFCI